MHEESYNQCLNCGSIWSPSTEEHDWQKCFACGWTPGYPVDEDDDWDEYDFDEDVDSDDLNDSRNL